MSRKLNLTLEESFMRFVSPEPMSGCWLWTSSVNSKGYGTFRPSRHSAHRVAYQIFKGPIPPGLTLDHKCRVRCCVNPDHLEPVSNHENVLRGQLGMVNSSKRLCPAGHEYTPENTYFAKRKTPRAGRPGANPERHCVTCSRTRSREYMRRKARERKALVA